MKWKFDWRSFVLGYLAAVAMVATASLLVMI
jgi:hypothetical protein